MILPVCDRSFCEFNFGLAGANSPPFVLITISNRNGLGRPKSVRRANDKTGQLFDHLRQISEMPLKSEKALLPHKTITCQTAEVTCLWAVCDVKKNGSGGLTCKDLCSVDASHSITVWPGHSRFL
jgi:hypothetical protein